MSLHCGYLTPEGVPDENMLNNSNSKIIKQVNLDKNSVSEKNILK